MEIALDKKRDTLCEECGNACNNGCSWSERLEPVAGWDAIYRPIGTPNGGMVESYLVVKCPEYIPDIRPGPEDMSAEGCIRLVQAMLDLAWKDYVSGNSEVREEVEICIRAMSSHPDDIMRRMKAEAHKHDEKMAKRRQKMHESIL